MTEVSRFLSPGISQVSRSDEGDDAIEDKESDEDSKVSPARVEGDIQAAEEVVSNPVLAVVAGSGRVWILEVATNSVDVVACPLLTGLLCWCGECSEL